EVGARLARAPPLGQGRRADADPGLELGRGDRRSGDAHGDRDAGEAEEDEEEVASSPWRGSGSRVRMRPLTGRRSRSRICSTPPAPGYDHVGPMAATVEGCIELLRALVPGFEPPELGSLDELRVGVAWLEHADPLVAERVRAAAGHFARAEPLEFPLPDPAENA